MLTLEELEKAQTPRTAYVYAYISDEGTLSHFTTLHWEHKDKSYVKVAEFTIIPANYIPKDWDWRPAAVKSLDEKMVELRGEMTAKITDLLNLKSRILQLTYDGGTAAADDNVVDV